MFVKCYNRNFSSVFFDLQAEPSALLFSDNFFLIVTAPEFCFCFAFSDSIGLLGLLFVVIFVDRCLLQLIYCLLHLSFFFSSVLSALRVCLFFFAFCFAPLTMILMHPIAMHSLPFLFSPASCDFFLRLLQYDTNQADSDHKWPHRKLT